MSSSDSDDFFGDAESESEGKEERRDELGSAALEECHGASPEESSSKDDSTEQPEQVSDGERSRGDDDGDSNGNVSLGSVQEEVVKEDDEGSGERLGGDEPVTHSDRSDELEKLFNVSLSGTAPSPASPQPLAHSAPRPVSARCRVQVVVNPAPGHSSHKEAGGKASGPPPPLLVIKSPVHDRPPPSPSSRSPRTPPTIDGSGINRILSKKEAARAGHGVTGIGGAPSGPRLAMLRGNAGREQPRQRPLGNYTRSLKMLGVKVPPAVPLVQRAGRSSSSQSWANGGRLHTRLTRRSTSLEDVTRAIPQVKTPQALHSLKVDEGQRATLSQAVYEEWYFARRQQLHASKVKAREQSRKEEEEKEREKKVKESKVSVAVSEWEKNKIEQMKRTKERLKKEAQKKIEEEKAKDEKNMQVSAALVAWETEKNELVTRRRERRRLEKEAKREVEKKKQATREEAEMVYKMWKQKKIEERKEKQIRLKEEEEELAWSKEEEQRRKREEADLAFNAWKRNKLKEERDTTRRAIDASGQKSSEAKRQEERSRQALQAYEAWLDHVEEREPLRLYEDARASAGLRNRPPWWPGGSSNSLLGC